MSDYPRPAGSPAGFYHRGDAVRRVDGRDGEVLNHTALTAEVLWSDGEVEEVEHYTFGLAVARTVEQRRRDREDITAATREDAEIDALVAEIEDAEAEMEDLRYRIRDAEDRLYDLGYTREGKRRKRAA